MKSIFLCDYDHNVKNVYPQNVIDILKSTAGLDDKIYHKADLEKAPNDFQEVQYIFSTWGMPALEEEMIRRIFPKLECVFYGAGTVQSFARPFLKCGVKVFSAWAANAVPVAEYTVAQIILANKGFYKTSHFMSGGDLSETEKIKPCYPGNYGATIGIIGAGMIGKLVIKMLKAYHLNCIVFDPFLPDETASKLGVKKCTLEEIFEKCNVVSNHLANNLQTKGMLNLSFFEKMPPYATFINTGRGAQVVEADLIKVLTERPDLTAILDVTEPEPPLAESPFYQLPNCILTPHIAGSSGDEVHRMAEYMLSEYQKYTSGKPTLYEVTEKMLETMA